MQKKVETTSPGPQKKKLELNLKVKVLEPKSAPKPMDPGPDAAVSPVIGYS